jgi:hypothetical protein
VGGPRRRLRRLLAMTKFLGFDNIGQGERATEGVSNHARVRYGSSTKRSPARARRRPARFLRFSKLLILSRGGARRPRRRDGNRCVRLVL